LRIQPHSANNGPRLDFAWVFRSMLCNPSLATLTANFEEAPKDPTTHGDQCRYLKAQRQVSCSLRSETENFRLEDDIIAQFSVSFTGLFFISNSTLHPHSTCIDSNVVFVFKVLFLNLSTIHWDGFLVITQNAAAGKGDALAWVNMEYLCKGVGVVKDVEVIELGIEIIHAMKLCLFDLSLFAVTVDGEEVE
jgi:hypothetical protein